MLFYLILGRFYYFFLFFAESTAKTIIKTRETARSPPIITIIVPDESPVAGLSAYTGAPIHTVKMNPIVNAVQYLKCLYNKIHLTI